MTDTDNILFFFVLQGSDIRPFFFNFFKIYSVVWLENKIYSARNNAIRIKSKKKKKMSQKRNDTEKEQIQIVRCKDNLLKCEYAQLAQKKKIEKNRE